MKDLACPCCKAPLSDQARCAGCGVAFQQVGLTPILIDFADSICRPEDYADAKPVDPPRGSAIGKWLHRLTYGRSDASRRNFARFAEMLGPGRRILIIGGGSEGEGTEPLYHNSGLLIVATDIYPGPHVSIVCDAHSLPFVDNSFDGVVIQAVLEHVLEPQRVVAEIERVLKPDGLVYAETPFLQHVHMGAYDFTRFTKSGHRWLFRRFTEVDAGTVLGPGVTAMWSIDHLLAGAFGRKAAVLLAPLFSWLRLLDRGGRLGEDGASALYFLGRLRDPGLKPSDMRDYYEATASGS